MVDDRGSPSVQIYADTSPALARMQNTAETAGCRIVSALPILAWTELQDHAVPGAAILIELESELAGQAAVELLNWLQQEAEQGARRGVVSAPAGLIDLIAASVSHPDIAHLCAAEEAERLTAVLRMVEPTAPRLHDVPREGTARLLQPSPHYAANSAGRAEAALVRAMIRIRRARGEQFPTDLFADPAWDMLLDLMAARLEGKKVAVSSLCIAAAVPPTTALRWIGILEDRGLVVRVGDPGDRRRAHVELVPATLRALLAWLGEARRTAAEVL